MNEQESLGPKTALRRWRDLPRYDRVFFSASAVALLLVLSPLAVSVSARTYFPGAALAASCLRNGPVSWERSLFVERTFADGRKELYATLTPNYQSVPYTVIKGSPPEGASAKTVASWFAAHANTGRTVVKEEYAYSGNPEVRFSYADLQSPLVVVIAYSWWISGLLGVLFGWLLLSPWRSAPRSPSRLRELLRVVGLAIVPALLTAGATLFLLRSTGSWGQDLAEGLAGHMLLPTSMTLAGTIALFYLMIAMVIRFSRPLEASVAVPVDS